jgi:DnaK suppressor protein
LAHTLQETLADVERALEKMDDGSFGACEGCGNGIPEPRLEAMPAAKLCIDCASKR